MVARPSNFHFHVHGGSVGKESACNEGNPGSMPDSTLRYSCLENSMERILLGYFPWGSKELDTTERLTWWIHNNNNKKLEQKKEPTIERGILRKASSKNTKIWDSKSILIDDKVEIGRLGFPGGSGSKESAFNVGDLGSTLRGEVPLEKGMATHYSILTWRVPCTEEPFRL